MSLGAGETTLLRLTAAYAMLVNGGKRIEPTLIDRIQDKHGKTMFRHDQRPCDGWPEARAPGVALPDLPDTREQVPIRARPTRWSRCCKGWSSAAPAPR